MAYERMHTTAGDFRCLKHSIIKTASLLLPREHWDEAVTAEELLVFFVGLDIAGRRCV